MHHLTVRPHEEAPETTAEGATFWEAFAHLSNYFSNTDAEGELVADMGAAVHEIGQAMNDGETSATSRQPQMDGSGFDILWKMEL